MLYSSLFYIVLYLLKLTSLTRIQFGTGNFLYNDIYILDCELWGTVTKSALLCIASCSGHCRSVAFNQNKGMCKVYNRYFTGQQVPGTSDVGWRHYDISHGNIFFSPSYLKCVVSNSNH